MKTIYKYQIEITDLQTLHLPVDSEILSVKEQDGVLCVWALHRKQDHSPNGSVTFRPISIRIVGTGHDIDFTISLHHFNFIETVMMRNGLVFHVFAND